MQSRPTWKQLLARDEPLLLPGAHDALSARLIERAGFDAYVIGGYALVGSRYALPDLGLAGFGEMSAGMRDIMSATRLPVLVDCDDGYGDAKNAARTLRAYEAMGVSAIFMEDQKAPKRCGHMAGKDVIDAETMATKLRAAVAARQNPDTFIVARTDARAVHGLDEALRRGELYLKAGADGLFIEAPQSMAELERVGRAFQGVPQLANMVEGGGMTPVIPPTELYRTRLRDGCLPGFADLPRRAHDREGAGRSPRRQTGDRERRRRLRRLQGDYRLSALGRNRADGQRAEAVIRRVTPDQHLRVYERSPGQPFDSDRAIFCVNFWQSSDIF